MLYTNFINITDHFANLPKDSVALRESSNDLLNELAIGKNCWRALSYNGDISFALNGGEYLSDDSNSKQYLNAKPTADNFHIVRPKNTLKVLDGFVISNMVDEKNETALYDFLQQVNFSGLSEQDYDGSPV